MGNRDLRVLAAVLAAVLPNAAAAVDLNGKWRLETTNPFIGTQIVTITQTGSSLTIPLLIPLTGTLGAPDPNGFSHYTVTFFGPGIEAGMAGRVNPSGNMLDGRLVASVTPPFFDMSAIVGNRCTCDDGNTINEDGCDDTCQVEPCWTCTGDPSTCVPTGDGGTCDDRADCTTGETCTGGVCGGGSSVVPCIDMTGTWARHREIPGLDIVTDFSSPATQRGGDVRLGPGYVGAIDPATGEFDLRIANTDPAKLFCFGFYPLAGTVANNGLTYDATGYVQEPQVFAPDHCDTFPLTELGSHCGDGDVNVVEECDDGNLINGDGCSAVCEVEACWTCSGVPSSCSPAPGDPCDDDNPCTTSDSCGGGGTCSGTPAPGTPCDDGSACTSSDTCAADGSCGGTMDCGVCETCNPSFGCVPDPFGTPCDDGDVCSTNSVCQPGLICMGTTFVTCDPCLTCDSALGCVEEAQPSCKASTVPDKSLLLVKQVDSSNDRVGWNWKKGPETQIGELGNPPGGDGLSICIYDESAATTSLLFRATVPGSTLWAPSTNGFKYKDPDAASDGIQTGLLRAGDAGRASAKVKGKGENLSGRPYALPALPLPLPLRVQIQGENGLCLETRHDSTSVLENDPATGIFKARGIP